MHRLKAAVFAGTCIHFLHFFLSAPFTIIFVHVYVRALFGAETAVSDAETAVSHAKTAISASETSDVSDAETAVSDAETTVSDVRDGRLVV